MKPSTIRATQVDTNDPAFPAIDVTDLFWGASFDLSPDPSELDLAWAIRDLYRCGWRSFKKYSHRVAPPSALVFRNPAESVVVVVLSLVDIEGVRHGNF